MSVDIEDRLVAAEADGPGGRAPIRGPGVLARLWALPVAAHSAVLLVVLVALLPFVGTSGIFSADEGAAIVQARQLARGDGWVTPYAFTRIDPQQRAFPLELSDPGRGGFAPFAKHPAYALVLAGADRAGGVTAMFVLSALGTAVAALFGGLLAARCHPSIARPALWVVGLASPLLFDSYLLIAHALGAACVAGATWAALRYVDDRRWWHLVGMTVALCGAAALRTEALLFAGALGGVLVGLGIGRRATGPMVAGLGAWAAAAAVKVVEPRIVTILIGTPTVTSRNSSHIVSHGVLDDRWNAFVTTWLRPSYGAFERGAALLVPLACLVVAGALLARRRPSDTSGLVVISGLVVATSALIVLFGADTVPGLVVAFPLLLAGFLVTRRSDLVATTPRVLFLVSIAFAALVLATEYRVGGSGEWGGRYFAIGLPVACPYALFALRGVGTRLDARSCRFALVAVVASCAALSILGLRVLRANHERSASNAALAARVSARTDPGDGGPPVIVTNEAVLPRAMWRSFPNRRLLLTPRGRVGEYLRRVDGAGVAELTFATRDPRLDLGRLGSPYRVVRVVRLGRGTGWRYAVLRSP
ncbi:MAG: hypothetical protein U0V73_11370 [Acidimicrobiia bacterium]